MKNDTLRLAAGIIALMGIIGASISEARAQGENYDCVLESRSMIELQSAEEGIIDELLVARGHQVEAGEIVARLESEQEALIAERAKVRFERDTGVLAAISQAEYRRKELDRLADLRSSDAIPQREFATARVESQLADIAVRTATMEQEVAEIEYRQARSRLERRSIRSPVDGVIVDVTMYPGEYLHEQATLMTIAEADPLHVETFMPVSQYGNVREGMTAEVLPEEPIGGVHRAEVAVVDNVFDAASRTFRVRLILPNEDYALPAGLRCTVRFLDSDTAD